jgi:hydroxymethylbilane synthase
VTRSLRIGTRGSPLALVQARTVAARLLELGVASTLVVIKTSGDRRAEPGSDFDRSLIAEGKRLFVKEIQEALLAGDVDLAVHSSKDMPAESPAGLRIVATLPREDPRDAVVLPRSPTPPPSTDALIAVLGPAPRIGTSSVRRIAQLTALFPKATFLPIRGNLGTRLEKLDAGEYDALVLAAAGLRRLGRHERISGLLPLDRCVPAPGQGIIAVEARASDAEAGAALAPLGDRAAAAALAAEQAVVQKLEGGCQMPIGAYAELDGSTLVLRTIVTSLDGTRVVRAVTRGEADAAEAVGFDAAVELLSHGADRILADVHRERAGTEHGTT